MTEKLQKVLARAGLGSRREMETWIQAGRVKVDDVVAKLGDRVSGEVKIVVDGHPLDLQTDQEQPCRVLMYNKPEGEICSRHDPQGRRTVFDRLPRLNNGRWIAVGRLDLNTSGLLLFTNDGELANRLMHPSHQVEREYAVRLFGEITDDKLKALTHGVMLEDGEARFEHIVDVGGEGRNRWFHVVINEGRNREVRRLWESQDIQVSRLIRVRYGNLTLERRLPNGGYVELDVEKINYLRELVDLKPEEKTEKNKPLDRSQDRLRIARVRRAVRKHRSGQQANKRKPSR